MFQKLGLFPSSGEERGGEERRGEERDIPTAVVTCKVYKSVMLLEL
jgi:hypothetical protein